MQSAPGVRRSRIAISMRVLFSVFALGGGTMFGATATEIVPAVAPHGARIIVVGTGLDVAGVQVVFTDGAGQLVAAPLFSQTSSIVEAGVPIDAVSGPVRIFNDASIIATFSFDVAADTPFHVLTTLARSTQGHDLLKNPRGISVDRETGDVYVADTGHHQIRRVRPNGSVELIAGAGAQFKEPEAIVYDAARRLLYVADTGNHVVRTIGIDGIVRTLAGSGRPEDRDGAGTDAGFKLPTGLALDRDGMLYVADTGNATIRRISPAGVVTTIAGAGRPGYGDGPAFSALFKAPRGVAVSHDGTVYVADTGNNVIRKIRNGIVTTLAGTSHPGKVDGAAAISEFNTPSALAFNDDATTLYIADTANHLIRAVTLAPLTVTTIAGTSQPGFAGGDPLFSQFHEPFGIDAAGALYVSDAKNDAIRLLFPALTATALFPRFGSPDGGTIVRLFGTGFVPGQTIVRFGTVQASAITFVSSTEILATAPTGAGTVDVHVSTASSTHTLQHAFTWLAPPTLASIVPASGSTAGNEIVSIAGAGFMAGETIVSFGDSEADGVIVVSPTFLTVTTPPHAAGAVDVRATTPAGTASLTAAYSYLNPPAIDAFTPQQGVVGTLVTISGSNFVADGTTVSFGGVAATLVSVSASQLIVAVPAGASSGPITVATAGGSATSAADFVLLAYTGIAVTPASISIEIDETAAFSVTGLLANGSSVPLSTGVQWTSANPLIATVDASGHAFAISAGTTTITATVSPFAASAALVVRAASPLPPDPAMTASPIDPSVPTSFAASMRFLYSGPHPVQFGVADGAIDEERLAVMRGRVLSRDGAPLSGARITVHGSEPLGYTLSRADGRYDLVVNGGGPVVLEYARDGFLSIQRHKDVAWNRFALLEDVVLVPLDAQVTHIEANADVTQVARGTEVEDVDGKRRATVIFLRQTRATMKLADGSQQPLTSLSVRATEYTVGPNGPKAMPATLPPQSGYTYCVELSADEALAANATSVEFSQEVAFYVDNFLGFPTGEGVPVGYYDRVQAIWVPLWNGRVVKILGIDGGLATIDTDGDGAADDDLFMTAAERQALAGLYVPGQTLWRIPLEHFTPFDGNWPLTAGNPAGALPPGQAPPRSDHQPDDPACRYGSVIQCESQALGESIPIAGTPFSLTYNSARVAGRIAARKMDVSLTSAQLPPDLEGVELSIEIGGQEWTRSYAPSPNLKQEFEWDGKDAYGRDMNGNFAATVTIRYRYPVVYRQVAPDAASFSSYAPGAAPLRDGRTGGALLQQQTIVLRPRDSRGEGLGGWTLDVHHTLDADGNALLLGNGGQRTGDSAAGVVTTVAGRGPGTTCEGTEGALGTSVSLFAPSDLASAPDGSIYVLDRSCVTVKRIARDGRVYHVAGKTSNNQYSGDGGPATLAGLYQPDAVAVGPDGSIYITHSTPASGPVVRRIAPNGIIETLGSKTAQHIAIAPDGALWLGAGSGLSRWVPGRNGSAQKFLDIQCDGVVVDPAGVVYAVTPGTNVLRIDTDGVPRPFANLCSAGGCLPNGFGHRLSRSPDGRLFVSEMTVRSRFRIYEITPEGKVSIAVDAANGDGIVFPPSDNNFGGDAGAASNATFDNPAAITIGADGGIYIADTFNRRVRKIAGTIAMTRGNERILPSAGGDALFVFDKSGRHLRTADARLGTTLIGFGYDALGRLSSVTDADGRTTSITRSSDGRSAVFEAPGGQQTVLAIGDDGYIASATDPAQQSTTFEYTPEGLLTKLRDPKLQSHSFTYTDDGLLRTDSNPAGGQQTLTLTEPSPSLFSIAVSTIMGRTTSYLTERMIDGDRKRTTTNASGLQTIETRTESLSSVMTRPDGTRVTLTPSPDPRFGIQAPLGTMTIRTPAGLTMTATATRSVVLSDFTNPFSFRSEVTTLTVNGKSFKTTIDAVARTVTDQTPFGRTLQRSFDATGRTTSVAVAGFTPVEYHYDDQGRVSSVEQGARVSSFTYDARDRVETMTDALSRVVRFEYDDADRLTRQLLPGDREIRFAYDANGNMTSITPPGRPSHLFTFTAADLTETYEPPGFRGATGMHFTYDLDGAFDTIRREDGSEIGLDYDNGGRLSTIDAGGTHYDYSYLSSGNLGAVSVAGQTLRYSYDGSLPKSVTWSGPVSGVVNYAYDNNFRTISENGVAFGYDADGLLTSAGTLQLQRNAANGVLSGTILGSISDTYSYDSFGELAAYTAAYNGTSLLSFGYTRDDAGRITAIGSQGYEYDDAGRLTRVTNDGVAVAEYDYDANSNRLAHRYLGGTTTATYDDQDRLLTYGDTTYEYTASGDLKTRTVGGVTTTFDYDAMGNLRSVDMPGRRIEYLIDGQNRRIGKKVDGVLVQGWLYGDQLRIVAELDSSGAVLSRFVYGSRSNVPDSMIRNGVTYRILSDHLGSPRTIVNVADGTVAQTLSYDEFGRVLADSAPEFQPFGFAGGLYDRDTGLVRFGVRDYDANTGRWTSKDPAGFGGNDPNLYAYVYGDPVNLIDPYGLDALTADPHARAAMAALFRRSLLDSKGSEWMAILYSGTNNRIYCRSLGSSHSANSNKSKVPLGLPKEVMVHTHPRRRTIFANDPGDVVAANKVGMASYVLSIAGIHKFVPDGKGGGTESTELDNTLYLKQNGQNWYDFTDNDACSCSGLK